MSKRLTKMADPAAARVLFRITGKPHPGLRVRFVGTDLPPDFHRGVVLEVSEGGRGSGPWFRVRWDEDCAYLKQVSRRASRRLRTCTFSLSALGDAVVPEDP